jgi:hypothetical protein
MTNPNAAVGTNAAYGGRTSVDAFNDDLQSINGRGVLRGWEPTPTTGLTIAFGGNGQDRDVAIAEDSTGNYTTINNISGNPVNVTLTTASATYPRIDLVVAYVNKPASVAATTLDNPTAVGIIPVTGTAAATPSAPDESAIRAAITADGGTGTTAYYVVLATVNLAASTTTVTGTMITAGDKAEIANDLVGSGSIKSSAITSSKINAGAVTTAKISSGAVTNEKIASSVLSYTNHGQFADQYDGWCRLGNGLAMVWGTLGTSNNVTSATATFPITFSQTPTIICTAQFNETATSLWIASVKTRSASGASFVFGHIDPHNGGSGGFEQTTPPNGVSYIAIGPYSG